MEESENPDIVSSRSSEIITHPDDRAPVHTMEKTGGSGNPPAVSMCSNDVYMQHNIALPPKAAMKMLSRELMMNQNSTAYLPQVTKKVEETFSPFLKPNTAMLPQTDERMNENYAFKAESSFRSGAMMHQYMPPPSTERMVNESYKTESFLGPEVMMRHEALPQGVMNENYKTQSFLRSEGLMHHDVPTPQRMVNENSKAESSLRSDIMMHQDVPQPPPPQRMLNENYKPESFLRSEMMIYQNVPSPPQRMVNKNSKAESFLGSEIPMHQEAPPPQRMVNESYKNESLLRSEIMMRQDVPLPRRKVDENSKAELLPRPEVMHQKTLDDNRKPGSLHSAEVVPYQNTGSPSQRMKSVTENVNDKVASLSSTEAGMPVSPLTVKENKDNETPFLSKTDVLTHKDATFPPHKVGIMEEPGINPEENESHEREETYRSIQNESHGIEENEGQEENESHTESPKIEQCESHTKEENGSPRDESESYKKQENGCHKNENETQRIEGNESHQTEENDNPKKVSIFSTAMRGFLDTVIETEFQSSNETSDDENSSNGKYHGFHVAKHRTPANKSEMENKKSESATGDVDVHAEFGLKYFKHDKNARPNSEQPLKKRPVSDKGSESEGSDATDDYDTTEYKLSKPTTSQNDDTGTSDLSQSVVTEEQGKNEGHKSDVQQALNESDVQTEQTAPNSQMGGSRRSKAFKTKMTFRRCKVTSDDPAKFNQEWSVMSSDESDDFFDNSKYNESVSWTTDHSNEMGASMFIRPILEAGLSGDDSEENMDDGSDDDDDDDEDEDDELDQSQDSSMNMDKEITQSALEYFQKVSSAASILQPPQPKPSPAPKPKKKKKKTKWREKNIKIIDGKKWRECGKCAKLFKTRREIREHNKLHKNVEDLEPDLRIIDGKRWRECSECKKLFRTRKELRIHFRIHTNEKPYECEVCGKGFKQLAHMNSHLKIHSGEKPYSCEICGMNFSEKSSLKRHIRRHLGIRPFKCSICGNEYYTSTLLKSHMNAHLIKTGEIESFTCHICGKKYSRKETLNKHLKTHDPEKRISCDICGSTFLTHSHLKRHKLTHKDNVPKSFFCGECGKEFMTSSGLKAHLHTHNKVRNWECEHCDWKFKDRQSLNRHKVVHDPAANLERRKHKCDLCDKMFVSRGNLTEHMKTHNKPEGWPFKCEICNKTYRRKSYLKNHMLNHDCKPHKCDECDKSYAFKKSLLEHIQHVHAPPEDDSDKFKCPECPKYFSRKDSLTSHMKVHSDMAVSCDICGKKFVRPSALASHRISHSSERSYECTVCASTFKFKKNLNRHLLQVHGINTKFIKMPVVFDKYVPPGGRDAVDPEVLKRERTKAKRDFLKVKLLAESKKQMLTGDELTDEYRKNMFGGDGKGGDNDTPRKRKRKRRCDGEDDEDSDYTDDSMYDSNSQYSDMGDDDGQEEPRIHVLKDKDDSVEQFLSKIKFDEHLDNDNNFGDNDYNGSTDGEMVIDE